MTTNRRQFLAMVSFALLTLCGLVVAAAELPKQLTDEQFWRIVNDLSEPGGYFRSDNFVSNEITFQEVIPRLKETIKPGGVYLGVGPDQNFTYIAALEPKLAFIVDIRRQNLVQHLMYKSIFELASDRADFLSRLFSRKRPEGLESSASAKQLFDAFAGVAPDPVYYHETLHAITENLTKKHRFTLTERDVKDLEYVFGAFFDGGPDITYSGPFGGRRMPTFATLMVQTDGEVNRSYMGSEETFKILQDMQKRNLVIPLVGDFAGPKALRAIGDYLKANGAAVSIIYTSNVEQYLFQQDEDWMKYYKNVETLPLDASAIFIRSAFNLGFNYGAPGGASGRFTPSRQLLSSVTELLKAFSAGEIKGYWDVLNMSN